MKPRIDLIYFRGCPHVEAARTALRSALSWMGMSVEWMEWDRDAAETPDRLRKHGSPTVLINGVDVVQADSEGECCRVYPGADRVQAAPSVDDLCFALEQAT